MIRGPTELCATAACALALAAAPEVRAEAPRSSLVVTRGPGAEDCPDAAAIEARASAMTHANPFESRSDRPRDTWVQVEFSRVLSGYRAVISARGQRQGTRAIDDIGPDCASLADAVTITLVMLLDPEIARPAPEPPRTAPAPAAPKPETEGRARARLQLGGEVSGGASLGILAHGAPFLEAGPTLRFDRWLGLALGGGFVFPDRAALPSGSVDLDLWYAYARLSARVFERGGTRVLVFLGPSTGSLGGEGVNYTDNPDERLWWIAGTLGAELHAALSPVWWWTARLFVLTPFRYEEFYVYDAGERQRAFRTPGIGGGVSFGVLAEP
ncbi:MAG TPA: hypothetical protein VGK73_26790 [Polyangiaceae bacterium]